MVIRDLPSKATVRFELLYVSGLTGPITINSNSFSSSANAGDTLLATANEGLINTVYSTITTPAIFIIRFEGKYFCRII